MDFRGLVQTQRHSRPPRTADSHALQFFWAGPLTSAEKGFFQGVSGSKLLVGCTDEPETPPDTSPSGYRSQAPVPAQLPLPPDAPALGRQGSHPLSRWLTGLAWGHLDLRSILHSLPSSSPSSSCWLVPGFMGPRCMKQSIVRLC